MTTTLRRLGPAIAVAVLAAAQPAQAAWPGFGGPSKADAGQPVVQAQAPGDAERFNRLEAQMRTLTGQVEELQFQVRQLQDALNRMQGGSASFGPPSASTTTQSVAPPPANARQVGTALQEPAPPAASGGLQPLDLSSLATGSASLPPQNTAPGAGASLQLTGDSQRDYQRGYDYILRGDYASAEQFFREFLKSYPTDQRAADAQFWIGESYFVRGQYREAVDEFLAGYETYPDSSIGPDTLLKLGLSLAGLGERETACSTYAAILTKYPDAPNSLRQRVSSERALAAC